jgi:hypothetical protein
LRIQSHRTFGRWSESGPHPTLNKVVVFKVVEQWIVSDDDDFFDIATSFGIIKRVDLFSNRNCIVKGDAVFSKTQTKLFNCFRCWIDIDKCFDGFIAGDNKIRSGQATLDQPFERSVVGSTAASR